MSAEIIRRAVNDGIFISAVFSRLQDKTVKKTVLTRISLRGEECYRAESFYTDGKARQVNIPDAELEAYAEDLLDTKCRQLDIITSAGNCTVMVSKEGKRHTANKIKQGIGAASVPLTHDRKKKYILDDASAYPFLHYLGVSSESGEVFDRRRAKYRQINRFLEVVSDIYDSLPSAGELTVCDLCCGKAYLTFAVYWYLTCVRQRKVRLYGVDRKADVMELCAKGAKQLGFDGMTFLAGDITTFVPERTPDLVVSLHACDIATDLVLSSAAKQGARVILSTPCCHHELMGQMNCPSLKPITANSILKQKLCDTVTDSLRALRLQAEGYDVIAMELIDPEETPKNVLLRCIRRKTPLLPAKRQAYLAEYDRLCAFFGVEPSIGKLLS